MKNNLFKKLIKQTLVVVLVSVIFSCKEGVVKKSTDSEKIITEEATEKPIESQKITSFTVSCGSGCNMIYYEKSIASNEVTFRVETYMNNVLSEENLETYVIVCDENRNPTKVNLKGDMDNILESELPMLKSEFKKYADYFCSKNTITPSKKINISSVDLIYNQKIDIEKVKYEILKTNISGAEEFLCGQKNMRYVSLPYFKNIKVMLVPQDCGDFNYRFFLLTMLNNKIISNQYVEGEWSEPENDSFTEKTSFTIDKNYKITVTTNKIQRNKSSLKEKLIFQINDNGTLKKI